MESQNDLQLRIEQRFRTMRILWIAMVLSIVFYYLFSVFARQPASVGPNSTLSLTLVIVGLLMIPISMAIKKRVLHQAVERQRTSLVQQGYLVAWAVTEVGALLGLLDFYITGNRYYYVLFIIAGCGQLLHFPRKQHVIDAAFKSPIL